MLNLKEAAYHTKNFLARFIPDCTLKRKAACTWRNVFLKSRFAMHYKGGVFYYAFKDFTVKAHENLYAHFAITLPDFLRYYEPKEDDIIVDCGAFKGSFATYMARKVPKGKVIAFEPNIHLYNEMVRNIELNKLDNVIPVQKAIWSENKKISFSLTGTTSRVSGSSEFTVDAVKLGDELKRLGIGKPDFIKADLEGAEIELVKSSKQMLIENDVSLAIASYHIVDGKPTHLFLEKFLKEIGYNCLTASRHLTTYASKKELKRVDSN